MRRASEQVQNRTDPVLKGQELRCLTWPYFWKRWPRLRSLHSREPERGLEEARVVQNHGRAAAFHKSRRSQHLGVSGSQF